MPRKAPTRVAVIAIASVATVASIAIKPVAITVVHPVTVSQLGVHLGLCLGLTLSVQARLLGLGIQVRLAAEIRLGPSIGAQVPLSGRRGIRWLRNVQIGLSADTRLTTHIGLSAETSLSASLATQVRLTTSLATSLTAGLTTEARLGTGLSATLGASSYLRIQV